VWKWSPVLGGGLFCIVLLVWPGSFSSKVGPPDPVQPLPTPAQLSWHAMEMNAFVHFTTNTFTGREWGEGDEDPRIFNPGSLDARQWARTFKEAGFKGVILTCKHHDGFCLWPSRYTDHSVRNSPYKNGQGDVVREVADACREYGLKFGVYVSPWDRNQAEYGRPAYVSYYRNQLRELFESYGPIFEMWFDGANGGSGYYGGARETRTIDGSTYYDWPATLDLVRNWEPNVIFFSDAGPGVRWCGNERGMAGETNWCPFSVDTIYPGKAGIEALLNAGMERGDRWIPAEVDVSIRPGWFYHAEEDSLVKSPERLFEIYLTSVGRGSTLLLNVPPDRRGLIHENDVRSLRAWRELINQAFAHDLARGAVVQASNWRGRQQEFSPANLTDGAAGTYWATDDTTASGTLELTFEVPQTIRYVVLQEYVALGQRVRSFLVEARVGGRFREVSRGTTIGYKRILKLTPVTTDAVRVRITDARACLALSSLEVY
jgi:alpha-L-fucosidase